MLTIAPAQLALAQTTAFSYQGNLSDSGAPASGQYDFQFELFDSQTVGTGTQQGAVSVSNVTVTNGEFNVQLDFGVCQPASTVLPGFLRSQ